MFTCCTSMHPWLCYEYLYGSMLHSHLYSIFRGGEGVGGGWLSLNLSKAKLAYNIHNSSCQSVSGIYRGLLGACQPLNHIDVFLAPVHFTPPFVPFYCNYPRPHPLSPRPPGISPTCGALHDGSCSAVFTADTFLAPFYP